MITQEQFAALEETVGDLRRNLHTIDSSVKKIQTAPDPLGDQLERWETELRAIQETVGRLREGIKDDPGLATEINDIRNVLIAVERRVAQLEAPNEKYSTAYRIVGVGIFVFIGVGLTLLVQALF